MKVRGRWIQSLAIGLGLALLGAKPSALPQKADEAQSTSTPNAASQGDSKSGSPVQPAESANASPDGRVQNNSPDVSTSSGGKAAPEASNTPENAKPRSSDNHAYALSSSYSVELPPQWRGTGSNDIPPPAPLGPYAPPLHLAGNLALSDAQHGGILQFATSNNPFIGHDSYWLDTQVHSPTGSGMSLLDFFFYYFFPPSDACMHQVLTTYADASRVAPTGETPSYMQVYYACPVSDTLSGFYSAQVSSGITFRLTNDGTRVLAPVGDFYVAPMEQTDTSGGMTFFVFEAQGTNAVSGEAARRFHLPEIAQGGQPDFFWAIGAPTPFPFVADGSRKDVAILHVAYARLGVGADARAEFLEILHDIRVR